MTYANPAERAALISGLRALADYLESSPAVPVSSSPTVYAFPPRRDFTEMRAEVDAIAARLGVTASTTPHQRHYVASRMFGPVAFCAVAIPRNDGEGE